MLEISSTFASNLNNKGINTICSLTPHDYGEYNSAYTNSRRTITSLLETNSNISMVIDVHRDAIEDLDFAPKTNLKGYEVASLMFVMGIGYDGEENPLFRSALGDYIAIAENSNKTLLAENDETDFSQHAGYTDDEIFIPLIIIDKT